MSFDGPPQQFGNRQSLSLDEAILLDEKIIPTALRWLEMPGLRDHAMTTLAYWQVDIPARHRRANPTTQEGN